MRYSKTIKFLHLVHNEIRWRQDSTVLAAVRTAGASAVCKVCTTQVFSRCNMSLRYVPATWPLVSAHLYAWLLLAGQAPISGHLSLTPLLATYENHSRESFHCSGFQHRKPKLTLWIYYKIETRCEYITKSEKYKRERDNCNLFVRNSK